MRTVDLGHGRICKLSDEDYEYIMEYTLTSRCSSGGDVYAYASGEPIHKRIARRVFGQFRHPTLVDHINHDTLDNTRDNLRLASPSQSAANQRKRKKKTSAYKGVSWHAVAKKWCAQVTVNRNRIYLGLFQLEEDAARAYNEAAIKYFGEFACTESLVK